MEDNLINVLSINERCFLLKQSGNEKYDIKNLQAWKERKSVLKQDDLDYLIKYKYESLDNFGLGITPIENFPDKEVAIQYIKDQSWYIFFESILDSYNDSEEQLLEVDASYPFRYFLQYARLFLLDLNSELNICTKEFIINLLENLTQELIHLTSKTLVLDLHTFKKNEPLKGNDSSKRFIYYLKKRFNSKKDIIAFYTCYPELMRITVVRMRYFLDNTKQMLIRVTEDLPSIQNCFNIQSSELNSISESQGDSHSRGKTVSTLTFSDGKKIVYKPKINSENKLRDFFEFLNKELEADIYIVKKVTRNTYFYEEYIDNIEINNIEEVKKYYERYGKLIGIAFLFNVTDLHYENIIAHGEYPVIIDNETFFQQNIPIEFGNSATVDAKYKYLDSIMVIGLVPYLAMKDKSDSKDEGVNLSALNFKEQSVPFKILKIKNTFTDEMRFEYQTHIMDTAKNTPIMNNEKISFISYEKYIVTGMKSILMKAKDSKKKILAYINNNLQNLIVRNVIRPTQRYADMLEFSYHPNCFSNAIEREKVLHNMWAYPYKNKKVVHYEFSDLIDGDIPIFYNNISKTSLIASDGCLVEDFYQESALNRCLNKINDLCDEDISIQTVWLEIALNIYNPYKYINDLKNQNSNKYIYTGLELNSKIIQACQKIEKKIFKRAIFNKKTNTVNWIDIKLDQDWNVGILNNNMYDGLPGIFIFYVALKYITKNHKYDYVIECIKNSIYTIPSEDILSAFFGKGSLIYPLLVDYRLNNDINSLNVAVEIADMLIEKKPINNGELKNDWIHGHNSIIKVLLLLSEITEDEKYRKFSLEIFEKLSEEPYFNFRGFGHGIYSYVHLLSKFNRIDKANSLLHKIKESYFEEEPKNNSWCKGTVGELLATIELYDDNISNIDINKTIEYKNKDCLCHGNAGTLEGLIQLAKKDPGTYQYKKNKLISYMLNDFEKNNTLKVAGSEYLESLGFFVGISGVGYELLRNLDSEIPNALLFEL